MGCRLIKLWTPSPVHWGSMLESCTCHSIHLSGTLDVVEKRIVAQASEQSKPPVFSFDARDAASIPVNVIRVADPALGDARSVETAHNQCRCRRLAEVLAAIHVKYILQAIGELVGNNIHHQIEALS